jgi:hypothetical protein
MQEESIHTEVLFAAGYVVFLVLTSIGFEWMARFSQRQIRRSRTVGFRFHHGIDAWECSQGTVLWPQEADNRYGTARYKADGKVCNRCGIKKHCTDLPDGRELVYSLRHWTQGEMGQFQRSFSITLIFLAAIILGIEAVRHHSPTEALLLAINLVFVLLMGFRTLRQFLKANLDITHTFDASEARASSPPRVLSRLMHTHDEMASEEIQK